MHKEISKLYKTFLLSQNTVLLRDKGGIFVGSRMGRPEKAKMRKHAGKPWTMAPQEEVTIDEFLDLLKSGDFASMTSKTIYNHVESYNSEAIKAKFQSLCDGDEYPTVIFKVNPNTKRPQEAKYVLCHKSSELKVFMMDNKGDITVEGQ